MKKSKFLLPLILVFISCHKHDWLEIKPNKRYDELNSLKSVESILDYSAVMNFGINPWGETSTNDIIANPSILPQITSRDRNIYFWETDIYNNLSSIDAWFNMYRIVFYSNHAIEALGKIQTYSKKDEIQKNILLGRAYFFRAYTFYHLTLLYGDVPMKKHQTNGLGIPLRLQSDINVVSIRSSIEESYNQVIQDLKKASNLLEDVAINNRRPTKSAAWGMLSKTYLQLQDFENSRLYADSALTSYNKILDYNNIENAKYPFTDTNKEIVFFSTFNGTALITEGYFYVSPQLFNLYDKNDLRTILFYDNANGNIRFKGNYSTNGYVFNGLTVPELLLIKAETNAREGNLQIASDALRALLQNRFIDNHYPDIPTNKDDLIIYILEERRRELAFRGLRWYDLRRLNLEEKFQTTICRDNDQNSVCLPPNDPRYLLPIPISVIERSEVIQNDRK